jgi:hypothetical protein
MKKLFLACCIEVLMVLTITRSSNAQNLNSTVDSQFFTEKPTPSPRKISPISDSGSLRLNERNPNAVRNFSRDFGNIPDARWIKSANGFVAYFVHDNIQNWIIYNDKGSQEFMIRDYYEEKLPRNVRPIVKSAYYDFSIFGINEITVKGVTIYVVTLKNIAGDKTFWKKVQVVDGEMELMKEYSQKTEQAD